MDCSPFFNKLFVIVSFYDSAASVVPSSLTSGASAAVSVDSAARASVASTASAAVASAGSAPSSWALLAASFSD